MPERIELSNRQLGRLANGHAVLLAWNERPATGVPSPREFVGEFGAGEFNGSPVSPESADAVLDRWIVEHIIAPFALRGSAGRDRAKRPVVMLWPG